tara:strand:- start:15523 stop:16617 length:1095 start_codon:yes stop_codon:yes gene_type:complete
MGDIDRIQELEEELRTTKYNKKSQHHIGLIKAKLARLKENFVKKSSGKGKQDGFTVSKSGDATVIMVGYPSVGKSTMLNAITNANSPIGHYAFTTLTCIPGLLEYNHAKIQVLDVPGIIEGASVGKGRGKEVLSCAQSADLVMITVDVFTADKIDALKQELYNVGLRLNTRPADVRITKDARGGVKIGTTVKLTKIDKKTIEGILQEFRLNNCNIIIRDDITADELIDAIEKNKRYVPAITVVNKIDMIPKKELDALKRKLKPDLCISADKNINMEKLKDLIFKRLDMIRIYCKEVGKKADMDVPLIIKSDSTLKDFCAKLHRDFIQKYKFARIWGKSVKYDGMKLRKLTHVLKDKDIVEVHVR